MMPLHLPAHLQKQYSIVAPRSTHWRPASCAEVDCPNHTNGWRVRVETLTPELLHAAKTSGRRFQELSIVEGETWLVFEAGQECFASPHEKRLEIEEIFAVRNDLTGRARPMIHSGADPWVDDFASHQQVLADKQAEGW